MEDRLGDTLFPAPGSQQRAAGDKSARNKVALKPGHSLMDWIRLTNSSKDLSGVGGKLLDVSPEELAKHCHPQDAWIALKGKVYNVTAYMDFHPGGSDELMRGIGKESTSLFNEVHKWVNFESMLSKCLVGRLKTPSVFLLKGFKLPVQKDMQKIGFLKPKAKGSSHEVMGQPSPTENEPKKNGPPIPKYDWYQSEGTVTIVIYNKWIQVLHEHIIVDVNQRVLRVLVNIQQHSYLLHLDLGGEVELKSKVKIGENTGNIEVMLEKQNGAQWAQLGTPLQDHNTLLPNKERDIYYRLCSLQSRNPVSYDTYLFTFTLPEGTHMLVPTGHHLHVKMIVDHVEVCRSYTPVSLSLSESPVANGFSSGHNHIHLMIKVYDQGTLTPLLNKLSPKDTLSISDPKGTFDASRLEMCEQLVLLAAGTGFTPMVKLISSCLSNTQINRFVTLLFFNKTENDILWKDQLDSLSSENERFQVHHILSSPGPSWTGSRGHIRRHLLETLLPPPPQLPANSLDSQDSSKSGSGFMVAVCGPTLFTKAALGILEELAYSPHDVFAFTG